MLSKWLPWDALENSAYDLGGSNGVFGFFFYDHFIEKIFLEKIFQSLKDSDVEKKVVLGNEISFAWLEENAAPLTLFGGNEVYIVLLADQMPLEVKKALTAGAFDFSSSSFIFCFNKDLKLFNQLVKNLDGSYVQLLAPRFWEGSKYLNFLLNVFKISLPYDVQNYLLESVENDSATLINVLKSIRLQFPDPSRLRLSEVKDLISPSKLDNFALASQFGKKRRDLFYKKLIEVEPDFESLRSFFAFMQGHLFKLLDPGYVNNKARMSRYDKEIVAHSKLWDKDDLSKSIRKFARYETEAKKKNWFLYERLRKDYFSQI